MAVGTLPPLAVGTLPPRHSFLICGVLSRSQVRRLLIYALGNEAIARGLLDAGVGVITGYPGTPSTEVLESVVRLKGDADVHVEWSVNEKVALEVAVGASWSGVRSAITMKHVGLNVASDPFMTLAYTGVGAGMVIVVADDPGCHSSQNEQDTRRYAAFAKVPCLEPSTPKEAYEMARQAPLLSEECHLPVILRPTTRVSHAKSDIELLGRLKEPTTRGHFERSPLTRVMVPAHARPAHAVLEERYAHLEDMEVPWTWLERGEGRVGIATGGVAYTYVREACERLGVKPHILKVGMYPIHSKKVLELLSSAERVLVVEELEPVIEEHIRATAQRVGWEGEIVGKPLIPITGELNVDIVEDAVASFLGLEHAHAETLSLPELPPRPPIMCAGCGHRATFYEIRKAFGKDAIFPSDIGCYTLGVSMGAVDTTLCMGASITVASGIAHTDRRSVCCTIGDSTFVHTGIPGLINAVYNGARLTVVVMDNRTTAMTGHQPHPAVGITATNEPTFCLDLAEIARACGATFVAEIDPYDVQGSIDTLKAAREHDGVSVVIARRECVILARRRGALPSRRFEVDTEACRGCRQCIEFGCPAIEFAEDSAHIGELCTGCGVCAQVCPFGAIVAKGAGKE
ncbi:MAG TPA: indolepyruvate ferredoxin oxidoreductase subunit alpha [Methermicoccus shengliensis]|uniref:Indolepyruvate oxidoreductase subunit IorA n=1 Tax=Methermicoccus shengliensis TaxID=660064 RepID=A0A832RY18_9EURY|nr:indolepyruvate ferredoxin oxidoreductase subunit alpha [Methermicoccus shengliensis]